MGIRSLPLRALGLRRRRLVLGAGTGRGSPAMGAGANAPRYWRTSKILLWDSKAMRFTNDEVANGYVNMPYRREWDYKVGNSPHALS